MAEDFIPYGRQHIGEEDIRAVVDVLRSAWLTQGPTIERFEHDIASYCGARYAVAVSSGTAALHIACIAAGLRHNELYWTSPNSFVASANCGLYCGAKPDFIDIDASTYNMCVNTMEAKLAQGKQRGTLPKVVIPVHFSGHPCDMARIHELSKRYGFMVIEDASHAMGSRYRGSPVGACAHSDMTVFSFHPVKIITTGEGGMVLTNNPDLYERLVRLRSHGITRDPNCMDQAPDGPWYYQQIDLGFNYRMTDIQAALGCSQLAQVDKFVARRRYLANRYDELLSGLPLTIPARSADTCSSFHLYVVRLSLGAIRRSHRQVFDELRARGIGVNLHYIPVHTQPVYRQLGFRIGDFPASEQYYREAVSLPMYYDLAEEQQDRVVRVLREILT